MKPIPHVSLARRVDGGVAGPGTYCGSPFGEGHASAAADAVDRHVDNCHVELNHDVAQAHRRKCQRFGKPRLTSACVEVLVVFAERAGRVHAGADAGARRAARAASYAKRFAAKEACSKALGTGLSQGVFWRDMGVANLPSGKPTMTLTGGALKKLNSMIPPGHKAQIDLSITDEYPLAQAIVIISAIKEN